MSLITSEFIIDAMLRTGKAGQHMKEMSAIVVDDIDPGHKLSKLKKSILKYKSTGLDDYKVDEEVVKRCEEYDEIMKKLELTDANLEQQAELMQIFIDPSNNHSKLLGKIGTLIRDEELNDDDKVDKIVDLLI